MGNVVDLSPTVTMREFTQVDGGKWTMTERVLNDPLECRRLVRTQIEELLALYRQYPLPEFESVRQILRPDAASLRRCRAVRPPVAGCYG